MSQGKSKVIVPKLPSPEMKIGVYVYTAMRRLEEAGFTFTEQEIDEMCTVKWSKENFHTIQPFMKRYIPGVTDLKGEDGYVRFKKEPYDFGGVQVLISKEWKEHQRKYFIAWYTQLR